MTDQEIIQGLIARDDKITSYFFFTRCQPLFYGIISDVFDHNARTIHQQVILREAGLSRRPAAHQVKLADIATFKWNGKKGRIGY
ncbi:MAG: hypothetical protein J5801_00150 [Bacteroidales bacterium]|nr:hypothetical protein [Bacteroidales bacterium]